MSLLRPQSPSGCWTVWGPPRARRSLAELPVSSGSPIAACQPPATPTTIALRCSVAPPANAGRSAASTLQRSASTVHRRVRRTVVLRQADACVAHCGSKNAYLFHQGGQSLTAGFRNAGQLIIRGQRRRRSCARVRRRCVWDEWEARARTRLAVQHSLQPLSRHDLVVKCVVGAPHLACSTQRGLQVCHSSLKP